VNFRIFLIVFFVSMANLPADAGIRKCSSAALTPTDAKAVHKVILRDAGQREVQWPSLDACVGTGYASVSVRLKPEIQPDGALMNFSLDCNRGWMRWACSPSQRRSAYVEMDVGGHLKAFDLTLPDGFEFKRVKPLVARAIEVGPKIAAEQECGYEPGKPAESRGANMLRDNQKIFRFYAPEISGAITESDGEVSLMVDDQMLAFVPDPNDATNVVFRCWAWLVIVA